MRDDEVLRSDKSGRWSDEENIREGGRMSEYSFAIQKNENNYNFGGKE